MHRGCLQQQMGNAEEGKGVAHDENTTIIVVVVAVATRNMILPKQDRKQKAEERKNRHAITLHECACGRSSEEGHGHGNGSRRTHVFLRRRPQVNVCLVTTVVVDEVLLAAGQQENNIKVLRRSNNGFQYVWKRYIIETGFWFLTNTTITTSSGALLLCLEQD